MERYTTFTCIVRVHYDIAVVDQKISGKEIAEPNFAILMDTDSGSTATTYISRIHIRQSSKR